MKARQLFLSAFVLITATTACTTDIKINEENFPDENFRQWILSQDYGADSVLTAEEIASVDTICFFVEEDINSLNIKGIEYFSELTHLDILNDPLTELDVTKNTKLKELMCGSVLIENGRLTKLDVSKNSALTELWCGENQMTELDVSKNSALIELWCYKNMLTQLDLSKNTELRELNCDENRLTMLDLSRNTKLKELSCKENQLTALDVSKNTELRELDCSKNLLTTLNISTNHSLRELSCEKNQLTELKLPEYSLLKELICYQNQIRGAAMDALVERLPIVSVGEMFVIYNEDEQNVMTKSQVAAAKSKGWTPKYFDGEYWQEYAGSEE